MFVDAMEPSKQNPYWYRQIYAPVSGTPEVRQAHRSFLLYRDAVAGVVIFFGVLGVWWLAAERVGVPSPGAWPFVILVGLILVLSQAARQSGNRMVVNATAMSLRNAD